MIYNLLVVVECFIFSLSTALTGKVKCRNTDKIYRSGFIIFKLCLFVVQDSKDVSDSAFGESSRFSFFTAISDMADK